MVRVCPRQSVKPMGSGTSAPAKISPVTRDWNSAAGFPPISVIEMLGRLPLMWLEYSPSSVATQLPVPLGVALSQ